MKRSLELAYKKYPDTIDVVDTDGTKKVWDDIFGKREREKFVDAYELGEKDTVDRAVEFLKVFFPSNITTYTEDEYQKLVNDFKTALTQEDGTYIHV